MRDDHAFGQWFFDDIREWVSLNLEPDEVYSEQQFQEWMKDRELTEFVPDDTLHEWALENGYVESADVT